MTYLDRVRLVLALAGLVFAVAGMATENRLVVWSAIGLLAASFMIRVVLKRKDAKE